MVITAETSQTEERTDRWTANTHTTRHNIKDGYKNTEVQIRLNAKQNISVQAYNSFVNQTLSKLQTEDDKQ